MKTTTACIGALSLATLAVAQPSGHRRHQHLHERRDEVVTVVNYVTSQMPDVVVYVDENGNVLSSVTSGQIATAAAAAPSIYQDAPVYAAPSSTEAAYVAPVASSSVEVYVAPASSVNSAPVYSAPASSAAVTSAVVSSAAASTKAATSTSASAAAASSAVAAGPSGYGIVYSPYQDDGTCKTADQVKGDFEKISGYSFVRSYGVDCNQVDTILAACKAKGMKLMLGVYDITATTTSVATIIKSVGSDWNLIDTIAIGNEGVNNGQYTVSAVVAALQLARDLLKVTGFSGKVVTVDTFVATIANPELCHASDYAAVNCHAFFDGGVVAADAGKFVLEQMQRVSSACGGKETWITETGWPSKGNSNGKAVPGTSEQASAIASIKAAISSKVVLFSAFNDFWKSDNAGTYGCEKYWGIYGSSQYSSQ